MSQVSPKTSNLPDKRFVYSVILFTLALTMVPYIQGYLLSNGRHYLWMGYNLDDACVYLSWMRQAMHGSIHQYNLFTTDSQPPMLANPLFWILGVIAGLTHLPLLFLFHAARLIGAFFLLIVVWQLICETVKHSLARRASLLFVCFASGLGWLPLFWPNEGVSIFRLPIDIWQPEAFTFLSIYLSPLFAVSMLLQVAVLLLLYRCYHSGRTDLAVKAGLCVLILGLVHTYDVVGLSLTWFIFILIRLIMKDSLAKSVKAWRNTLISAIVGLPGIAIIAWELHSNSIFHKRAEVPTLAPAVQWILVGYGCTLLLALVPVYLASKGSKTVPTTDEETEDTSAIHSLFNASDAFALLLVWAVCQMIACYLPVAFQRKMIQGEHFPLAILAGVGAGYLLSIMRKQRLQSVMLAGLTLFLSLSNIRFLLREMSNNVQDRVQTLQQRPYLLPGEIAALNWVRTTLPAGAAVQPLPWVKVFQGANGQGHLAATDMTLACVLPGLTGHAVWCGHWGETPEYGPKLGDLMRFALPQTSNASRMALLLRMKVSYLIFSQKSPTDTQASDLAPMFRGQILPPNYLTKVYSNPDADVYKIQFPTP